MSKIAISPGATGAAVFTIQAPSTETSRTLNLPDAAGTVFVGGQALSATTGSFSGNVTLGSSVLETPTGSAPAYLCRAWVNFNGVGTPAIRGSGNVSSVTGNGTGRYTVNFTTAMPDANYCGVGTLGGPTSADASTVRVPDDDFNQEAGSCRVGVARPTVAYINSTTVQVSFFR